MPKLNQIVAIEKGAKTDAYETVTKIHQKLQVEEILNGLVRTYTPKDDDGERKPSESKRVQYRAHEAIDAAITAWTKLLDVTATKDTGNTKAVADIIVDGKTLIADVPVTHLLFLEKQVEDLRTFCKKLPTLSDAEDWTFDTAVDLYVSDPTETTSMKKVPRAFVKAPATDKHPAQVDTYTEDVPVGTWKVVKQSGALPASDVNAMLERVEKLAAAIKIARETANSIEVSNVTEGKTLLSYIFG